MSISVERQLSKAKQAIKKGQIEQAKKFYRDVLQAYPNNTRVREALANLDTGSTGKVRPIGSSLPETVGQLGQLFQQGRFGDIIQLGQKVLRNHPRSHDIHNIVGAAFSKLARHQEAVNCFSTALEINPDSADAHNNLGNAYRLADRQEEAIECYRKALRLDPRHFDALNNLGVVHKAKGELPRAIEHFSKALQVSPRYATAHFNMGNAYQGLSQHEDAVRCYQQAVDCHPDYANAYKHMALSYNLLRDFEATRTNLAKALRYLPDDPALKSTQLHVGAQLCEWDTVYADPQAISESGLSDDIFLTITVMSLEDAPDRHLARSVRYAERYAQNKLPDIPPPDKKPERLRIGYFSAEFHNHACMIVMAKLFEIHDREQFSLHAFSYGPHSTDPMRDRVKSAFDQFQDVRDLDNKQIAELARSQGIDIAVHITGYTANHRTGIFSFRAAPVQINYLGYPGTLGAPFIDYMVADSVIVTPETRAYYTENLISLPNTYMPSDDTREISGRPIGRAEMGLPENGFVFCCFNTNAKITPQEFDIWMRLLQNVDNSVLWLRYESDTAEQNLRDQAARRNVDPDRIVFAHRTPEMSEHLRRNVDPDRIVFAHRTPEMSEHLTRHRLADLFLDTFNYNAHATASDALYAGLPVITKTGQGFPARVAASLLTAIDLPELITNSAEEYEALALELATNPAKLRQLKSKLDANRNRTPLFDTELFTRHIESGYQQAYQRYFDGKPPADIFVSR